MGKKKEPKGKAAAAAGEEGEEAAAGGKPPPKKRAKKSAAEAAAAAAGPAGDEDEYGGGAVHELVAEAPPPPPAAGKGTIADSLSTAAPDLSACFVFSGVRDKDVEAAIVAAGGSIAKGFTKAVTAVIAGDEASPMTEKVKAAVASGIPIFAIQAVKDALGM